MADFATPNYQLTEPEVGSSSGTWGGKLNTGIGLVDNLLAKPRPVIAVTADGELDLADGLVQQLTVDGDTDVSFINTPVAESGGNPVSTLLWVIMINGGAHAVTYDPSITFVTGIEPTLKTSGVDLLLFVTGDEGTSWAGAHIGSIDDGSVTNDMLEAGIAAQLFTGVLGRATLTGQVVLTSFGTITLPAVLTSVYMKARIRVVFGSDQVGNPLRVKFGSLVLVDTTTLATPTVIEIDVTWKTSATQDAVSVVVQSGDTPVTQVVAGTVDMSAPVVIDFQGNPQGGSNMVLYGASVEALDGTP